MERSQRQGYFGGDTESILERYLAIGLAVDVLSQRLTLQKLHQQIDGPAGFLPGTKDLHKPLVVHFAAGDGFTQEAFSADGVAAKVLTEQLDGNALATALVNSLTNDTHPSARDLAFDAVGTEYPA
jgi:hypothetical protein